MSQRNKKLLVRSLLLVLVALIVFYRWYLNEHAMKIIKSFEVSSSHGFTPVLIATQGSEYKDQLCSQIIEHFENDPIYFKVIDVTNLPDIESSDWQAIVLMHTWEKWKPQKDAARFILDNYNKQNMVVVTTSGSGEERIENVDAITGASNLADVADHSEKVMKCLKHILSK
jgi:hypothetical protein